jgi:hypothetical protein
VLKRKKLETEKIIKAYKMCELMNPLCHADEVNIIEL